MADITLTVAGREHAIHCRDGEEDHLRRLAAVVDSKVAVAGGGGTGLGEVRQLLFAALFLADELHDIKKHKDSKAPVDKSSADDSVAIAVEALAGRLEVLAERLAPAPVAS